MTSSPPLHITIAGGGITALALATGLQARGIPFTVLERAPSRAALLAAGAGLGLSPNAEHALRLLAPDAHAAFERVANDNGEDYFQWINGVTKDAMYRLWMGDKGFRGCKRADLLRELGACLLGDCVRFGREVVGVRTGDGREGRQGCLVVEFADGREEGADTVIAADGINSRLRTTLFAPPHPPTAATYTQKSSFRALVPLAQARAILGPAMVATRFMYNGPGAHMLTYPVANDTLLNVLVVISCPTPSPDRSITTKRRDVEAMFAAWHPHVRAIVRLLPEELERWDICDMYEAPAPAYHGGAGVVLAGDAAHAVGPHLGAGAGMGIEDALLLAEMLAVVRDRLVAGDGGGGAAGSARGVGVSDGRRKRYLQAAYALYTELRYERTQWLVRATREAVDLLEWKVPEVAMDPKVFGREITWRFHRIWEYDVGKMVADGRAQLAVAMDAIDDSA